MNEVAQSIDRLTDLVRRERQRLEPRYGARPLRRMGLASYLENIPGLAARFTRQVPAEMFMQVDDGEIEVACPCGDAHRMKADRLHNADCGRSFVWAGGKVFVAAKPEEPPPVE